MPTKAIDYVRVSTDKQADRGVSLEPQVEKIRAMATVHDVELLDDLERYHLGMVKDGAELAALEEHLLWCGACVDRAGAAARYVDAVRAAACDSAE